MFSLKKSQPALINRSDLWSKPGQTLILETYLKFCLNSYPTMLHFVRGKYILRGFFGQYFPFSALNILENRELKTRWRLTRDIVWGRSITIEAVFILLREFQAHWLCSGCLCQPQNLTSSPLKKCWLWTQVPYCPCPKYDVQSFFSLGQHLEHRTREGLSNLVQMIFQEKKVVGGFFHLPWSNTSSTQN